MKHDTIIADTSCLIVLENIGELPLLKKIYGEVLVTQEVADEFASELPEWIEIRNAIDQQRKDALCLVLDIGEASAIALSLESPNSILIIDEKKGRGIARQLNIKIIGTLGIILKAKENGLIESTEEILNKLEAAGFRVSRGLRSAILDS